MTACWRYEPRKHPRILANYTHPEILPSPLRDKVGYFNHDRFRGYLSVHFRSGLQPSCLRFAVTVTEHHARLGTQLLAKLYCGCHLRQLYFMRLQGATPTVPDVKVSLIRFLGFSPFHQTENHSGNPEWRIALLPCRF